MDEEVVNNELNDLIDQLMPDEEIMDGTPTQEENQAEVVEQEETEAEEETQVVEPVEAEVSEDDWKAKFEALQKQHTDYQSYNDRARNDLQKQLAELSQKEVKEEEAPKPEINFEELGDLLLDDPAEFSRKIIEMTSKPQQNEADFGQLRIQMMEDVMRTQHQDYDSVVDLFKHAASVNPELTTKFHESEDKVKFAYQEGKKLLAAQEIMKDPVAYENKIRQQIEEKLREKTTPKTLQGINTTRSTKSKVVSSDDNDSMAKELLGGFGFG